MVRQPRLLLESRWAQTVKKSSGQKRFLSPFFSNIYDSLFPLLTLTRWTLCMWWCHFFLIKALLSLLWVLLLLLLVLLPFFCCCCIFFSLVICLFTFVIVCLSNQSSLPRRCFFFCCDKYDPLTSKRKQHSGHAETALWCSLSKRSQQLLHFQLIH